MHERMVPMEHPRLVSRFGDQTLDPNQARAVHVNDCGYQKLKRACRCVGSPSRCRLRKFTDQLLRLRLWPPLLIELISSMAWLPWPVLGIRV
jgi:hypothetical protein